MRTVLLASLRHHRRRYVASALAVVIGVAFIVTVNGLAGALRSGMTADLGETFDGVDWVVSTSDPEVAQMVSEAVAADGGAATARWSGWLSARSGDEELEGLSVGTVALEEPLQWQRPVTGRLPVRNSEAVVGEKASVDRHLAVGDSVTFPGADVPRVTIVGVVDDPSSARSDLYLTPADAAATGALWIDHVTVAGGRAGLDALDLQGASVDSKGVFLADLQAQITRDVDVIALMVSIFAAIALMVAVLVITNTFAILFAQRARDFALLRCVGVTRKQLRRSVRVEARVLGVVSSLLGALLGVGLAFGLTALVGVWADVLGPVAFQASWVVGALVIGVLVTVASAWLPTRAVTRIAPLAALRPQGGIDPRSRAGVLRAVLGSLVVASGGGVLAAVVSAVDEEDGPSAPTLLLGMLGGGAAAFVGVLLLGPFLVPAALRLLGGLVSRRGARGAVTRLATSNAVRNPRRTATTAASLMVGVTLTTAVLTGMASVQRSLDAEMEASYPLDVALVPTQPETPVDRLLAEVRRADGVSGAEVVPSAVTEVAGEPVTLVAVSGRESTLRAEDGDLWSTAPVQLPFEYLMAWGDDALPTSETGEQRLALGEGLARREVEFVGGGTYGASTLAVAPRLFDELVADGTAAAAGGVVWARADDGVEPTDLDTALARAAQAADVTVEQHGEYATRDFLSSQFTIITVAVVGLLSVAVVIALIGIANTLGLSVLERTRENALLRAMGLTKAQLRRTLAWEGVLLSVVATVMGIAVGLAFAWVGVQVLVGAVMVEPTLSVPMWQLLVVVLVSVVAGIGAAVVPARKAATVSPAEGLTLA